MIAVLFIPFADYESALGGPATFMRNLERYLVAHDVPFTRDPQRGRAAFFPIAYDLKVLARYHAHGYPIVQRLDGVYNFQRNGLRYILRNRPLKRVYRRLASHCVFQSDYCRRQCFAVLGERPADSYTTIVNGVDPALFYPDEGKRGHGDPLRLITTGSFRHADMLLPIVEALDLLAGETSLELRVVGPVPDLLRAAAARPFVRFAGSMDALHIAEALRGADLYLFSSLNPPCPNALLEAVASGIPVVAFADGSTPELLSFAPELLAEVPARLFVRASDLDPARFADKIRHCLADYDRYLARSRDNSRRYDFDDCGAAYVRTFEAAGCLR